LLSVQWINPDDGQRNCPKHVEFHSQNKFEKLVHLVGFIIKKIISHWRWESSISCLKKHLPVLKTETTTFSSCRPLYHKSKITGPDIAICDSWTFLCVYTAHSNIRCKRHDILAKGCRNSPRLSVVAALLKLQTVCPKFR
jgi:hypothetical protein